MQILDNETLPENAIPMSVRAQQAREKLHSLDTTIDDVIGPIFQLLPVPDRICLALTSKFFARKAKDPIYNLNIHTETSDDPVIIGIDIRVPASIVNAPGKDRVTRTNVGLFSTRRMTLLALQNSMPKGYTLCWRCHKYGNNLAGKWVSADPRGHGMYPNLALEPLIEPMLPQQIHAHTSCCRTNIDLWQFYRNMSGAGYDDSIIDSTAIHVDALFDYIWTDTDYAAIGAMLYDIGEDV